jgi:outer membrane receptor for ferric coprogen and ferric-rhodotorulic acid
MYATVGLQLANPLRLIAGARYSSYEIQSQTYYADAAGVLPSEVSYGANYKEHALVPSVALTYEITPNWSAYASYAQSFTPQAQLLTAPVPGSPMSAITGKGFELGVKGTAFEGLNTSLAIYRVLRSGEGIQDPAYPFTPGEFGAACCYVSSGDVITQGLDLEFSGRILPGWQLFSGYTYSERESNKASVDDFTGTSLYLNWTPKHLFKAWTTWNLPGSLSKWTLNAGVQAQSEFSGYGFPTPLPRQGGYAIWNASVQYRMNDSWSAALYAENLLDKTYYEAMSTVRNEGLYGVPRNFILRMQYKF